MERGTHDELVALGGAYADLYNSQFAGPDVESEPPGVAGSFPDRPAAGSWVKERFPDRTTS